jgi:hypothetical protein
MGMSASELGREFFSRTAQETNKLLLAHGFLEGAPGAYRPTSLGESFAKWVDKDNGYGGVAARSWSWITWSDEIVPALKASIDANPNGVLPPADVSVAVIDKLVPAAVRTESGPGGQLLNKKVGIAVAVLAALGSTPVARRAWHEKVKPTASRVRTQIAERKSAKRAAGAAEGDPGTRPAPGR